MSAPRVAVVVVTYNSADVLPGCLESLRDCGAEDVELTDVVVVDNASGDSSTEIAKATDRPADLGRPDDGERRLRGRHQRRRHGAARPAAGRGDGGQPGLPLPAPDARHAHASPARARARHRRAAPRQPERIAAAHSAAAAHRPRRLRRGDHRRRGSPTGWGWASWSSSDGPHDGPGPAAWVTGAALLMAVGPPASRRAVGRVASCSTARRRSTCCAPPTRAGPPGTSRPP